MIRIIVQIPTPLKAKLDTKRKGGMSAIGLIRHLLEQHFHATPMKGQVVGVKQIHGGGSLVETRNDFRGELAVDLDIQPTGGRIMVTPHVKQTSRKTPAWEGRARTTARQLGVSEAKVIRQVKRELIRTVAEQIAKDEHQRVRATKAAPRHASPRPSGASSTKARTKKVVAQTEKPIEPTSMNDVVPDKEE